MGETKIRSLVRAITWRMFSIFLGIGISQLFVHDIELVIKMNIIFVIVGTSCQYVHERLWNRVKWGIESNEEPSSYDESM
jgi:uncharacterized membrane protein